ncbi:hypothetical protein KJA15_00125 [Patescibacteria group bacterium]|nr:hypothetical protein [Patescibacteria group bacterium]
MKKQFQKKLKEKLEKEREIIQRELQKFAKKDVRLKGDWDTRFPYFNGEAGGAKMEKAANEVEEYETLLPIEYTLETKLKNINLALGKIKRGEYGICEKCRKPINIARLKVCPEARTCLKCKI